MTVVVDTWSNAYGRVKVRAPSCRHPKEPNSEHLPSPPFSPPGSSKEAYRYAL